MNLSTDIKVFPGTDRQVNVGIMGRAVIYLTAGNETIASFSQVTVKQTKQGKWWIQWPSEDDPNGAMNDRGYPKSYPYYRIFPGEESKQRRIALENQIINELRNISSGSNSTGGGSYQQNQSNQNNHNQAPVTQRQAPASSPLGGDDQLTWDLSS